jgi:hypothetical protein
VAVDEHVDVDDRHALCPDQAHRPPTQSLRIRDLAPELVVSTCREAFGGVAVAKSPDSRFIDSASDVEIIGHQGPMTAAPIDSAG